MNTTRQIRVRILDLGCGGADASILERILIATDGVSSAYVNRATETAYVNVDPAEIDAWSIRQVIARAGFTPGGRPEA